MPCEFTVKEIKNATGASLSRSRESKSSMNAGSQEESLRFVGVGTDTRDNLTGQVFIALKGDRFDAHNFLKAAVDQGAAALVIEEDFEGEIPPDVPLFRVVDTLKALQDLAHYWRKKNSFEVLALTGSNGKTSTKSFAHTLISSFKKTAANPGSFNNHWGVPLSLLRTDQDTEVIIVEMGMNHLGEIAQLCKIAEPDVALVTMVGSSHIGELGSKEKIALAKEEIYKTPTHLKTMIFNLDNEETYKMYQSHRNFGGKVLSFSEDPTHVAADVHFSLEEMTLEGLKIQGQIAGCTSSQWVPIYGEHNLTNLMAACCMGLSVGVPPEDLWRNLKFCKASWGRGELISLSEESSVLFDAYNANFESMKALIENMKKTKGHKNIAVFGQMFELGDSSYFYHKLLGEEAAQLLEFQKVYFVGKDVDAFRKGFEEKLDAKHKINFEGFKDYTPEFEQATYQDISHVSGLSFIKASRGMGLERLLKLWRT